MGPEPAWLVRSDPIQFVRDLIRFPFSESFGTGLEWCPETGSNTAGFGVRRFQRSPEGQFEHVHPQSANWVTPDRRTRSIGGRRWRGTFEPTARALWQQLRCFKCETRKFSPANNYLSFSHVDLGNRLGLSLGEPPCMIRAATNATVARSVTIVTVPVDILVVPTDLPVSGTAPTAATMRGTQPPTREKKVSPLTVHENMPNSCSFSKWPRLDSSCSAPLKPMFSKSWRVESDLVPDMWLDPSKSDTDTGPARGGLKWLILNSMP
ncbi:hypothetical protein NL676_032398 [Syzygium grande]|nr:hypothetical protein NL676_032398 [Syzygium grande]